MSPINDIAAGTDGPNGPQGKPGPTGRAERPTPRSVAELKQFLAEDWADELARSQKAGDEPMLFCPVVKPGGMEAGFHTIHGGKEIYRTFNTCTAKRAYIIQGEVLKEVKAKLGRMSGEEFAAEMVKLVRRLVVETACSPQAIEVQAHVIVKEAVARADAEQKRNMNPTAGFAKFLSMLQRKTPAELVEMQIITQEQADKLAPGENPFAPKEEEKPIVVPAPVMIDVKPVTDEVIHASEVQDPTTFTQPAEVSAPALDLEVMP
jgi:hypothetical protein